MLVEVADATLTYHSRIKLPLYAQAGIVETWIVDVQSQRTECFHAPSASGYQKSRTYAHGNSISPLLLPPVSVTLDPVFS